MTDVNPDAAIQQVQRAFIMAAQARPIHAHSTLYEVEQILEATLPQLRALSAENEALRAQLATARNDALREAADKIGVLPTCSIGTAQMAILALSTPIPE